MFYFSVLFVLNAFYLGAIIPIFFSRIISHHSWPMSKSSTLLENTTPIDCYDDVQRLLEQFQISFIHHRNFQKWNVKSKSFNIIWEERCVIIGIVYSTSNLFSLCRLPHILHFQITGKYFQWKHLKKPYIKHYKQGKFLSMVFLIDNFDLILKRFYLKKKKGSKYLDKAIDNILFEVQFFLLCSIETIWPKDFFVTKWMKC